jgi:type III restriction enzyme
VALGSAKSRELWEYLKAGEFLDRTGKVFDTLRIALKNGRLPLPPGFEPQAAAVSELLRKLAGKLDVKDADTKRVIRTRRAVLDGDAFKALWDRIKGKTTYRVAFDDPILLRDCAKAIADAPPVAKTRVQVCVATVAVTEGGVQATEISATSLGVLDEGDLELPDIPREM